MLAALSISEYTARLASPEPAPGGGSAAALSGLLGVGLLEMVLNITLGDSKFSNQVEPLAEKQVELAKLHIELKSLIDRDAAAFAALIDAYKLPEAIKTDKQARAVAICEAARLAAEVPLATARFCLEALEIAKALLGKANPQVSGDLLIGALASHTGAIGALLNTAVNLPLLKDRHLISALEGQMHLLRTAADDLIAAIRCQVYAERTFAVMQEE